MTILLLQQRQTIEQHASGTPCNDWGVTQNFEGLYSFARLAVDSNGNVVDANNPTCVIHLVGLNQAWFTSGVGGGPDASEFDWYKQHLHYNIIRVAYNSRWWEDKDPLDNK